MSNHKYYIGQNITAVRDDYTITGEIAECSYSYSKTTYIVATSWLNKVPVYETDIIYVDDKPVFRFALREDIKDDKRFLPVRATSGSAGWDVSCAFEDHQDLVVQPGQYLKIPLGIRCIMPPGWWLSVKPRSSSFVKKKLHALYGTADSDFRNFLYFCAKSDNEEPMTLNFGERIGQLIPVKMQEMVVGEVENDTFDYYVNQENNNTRKYGGFGSTSK